MSSEKRTVQEYFQKKREIVELKIACAMAKGEDKKTLQKALKRCEGELKG